MITTKKERDNERVLNTFCAFHCMQDGCAVQATVRDDRVVHLEKHPKVKYPPCAKMWTNIQRLYHPDRLKYPMKRVGERGEGKWERITWDEALDTVVERLNEVKAKYGNESILLYHYAPHLAAPSGFLGMWATLQRLFNLWGGCIPSYERGSLCWQAFISASCFLYGSYKVFTPPDNECELIIIWSTNPALGSGKGPMNSFLDAKERGTKFIVIDPVFTDSAAKLADEFVPILPGTDLALALAMMNIIIKEGLYDKDFIVNHTNAPFLVREDNGEILKESHLKKEATDNNLKKEEGSASYETEGTFQRPGKSQERYLIWDLNTNTVQPHNIPNIMPAFSGTYLVDGIRCKPVWQRLTEHVAEWTPEKAAKNTEIPQQTIEKIAREFGKAKPAKIFFFTGGFQRTTWGENATYALGSLNTIVGSLLGEIAQWEPRLPSLDLGILETMKKLMVPNPVKKRVPISHLAEAILNPEAYGTNIKALFVMNGNPVGQHPNANKTIGALKGKELEFIAVTDIFMSETAKYADIILPANTLLERAMIWESSDVGFGFYTLLSHTSPKRYILFAEKAVESLWESRDDFEIICDLAHRMGFGEHLPWNNAEEWIEDLVNMAVEDPRFPWLKGVTMKRLKNEGVVKVDAPPQKITWDFNTPSGKIELYSETLLKMGYDPLPVYRELAEGPITTPELYKKYPLYFICVHYKYSVNSSYVNQPEMLELGKNDVLIHPSDAEKRGIRDGDLVLVFNDRGSIQIQARVAEEIKPGVVRIGHTGWEQYGNTSLLTSDRLTAGYGENPTNNTCLVEVKKL